MNDYNDTRRAFLRKLVSSGFLIAGSGLLWAGCNSNNEKKSEEKGDDYFGGNCGDYSKLTPADHAARERLGYEEKSPVVEQQCHFCNLWLPPKEGQSCGGCTLFKGPIEPKGTCTYWAPKQS